MAQKNLIKRIISSPLVQTFLIYVSGAWIALELTDYIISKYELNEKIGDILPVILLIGLPLTIFFSWYLSREKDEIDEKSDDSGSDSKPHGIMRAMRVKPWFSIPGTVLLILLIITGIRYFHRRAKIQWAREYALSQIKDWSSDYNYVDAFYLAREVKKFIPDDTEFKLLDTMVTKKFNVITDPEGADVFYKEYSHVEDEWILLGTTPLVNIEMPNVTLYRWKIEKEGFEVVYAAAPTHMDTLFRAMHIAGTTPEGMVYVEGLYPQTVSNLQSQHKNGFNIDRNEVTNEMYKIFMDQGGYQNPEFWQHEFILNGETLTFEEAMAHFRDFTGRPGPSTWEAGDYPDGQDNYPVNGISWYEASAYAAYAGKSLPTKLHWQSAAGFLFDRWPPLYGSNVVPASNMGGAGPEPVGSKPGISYSGAVDMAGNVREWCWNESPDGRIILGGAWNDVSYMSTDVSQLPAFNRSEKNGFRCVIYDDSTSIPEQTFQLVAFLGNNQDYRYREPVSESEFQIYKKQFQYDRMALNSQIEDQDDSNTDWIMEKVSFDAAYENERMTAYLFLPKEAAPPYQTLIFFPGAYAAAETNFMENNTVKSNLDFIMKNGRAMMFPIYKTTYERSSEVYYCAGSSETHQYTECMVKCVKDFSRSVDYLETRKDIDTSRLCYYGDSWGGRMGAIILAVEDRLKLGILIRGGLSKIKKFPEADEFNYVSYVNIPVLMLNGKYDFSFPFESTVKPMFDLTRTPEEDKKLVTYETDHYVPKSEIIKETLDWLDTYFGPVRR